MAESLQHCLSIVSKSIAGRAFLSKIAPRLKLSTFGRFVEKQFKIATS
jgi:hypothetical protein